MDVSLFYPLNVIFELSEGLGWVGPVPTGIGHKTYYLVGAEGRDSLKKTQRYKARCCMEMIWLSPRKSEGFP